MKIFYIFLPGLILTKKPMKKAPILGAFFNLFNIDYTVISSSGKTFNQCDV